MPRARILRFAAVVPAAALLTAACGGTGGGSPEATVRAAAGKATGAGSARLSVVSTTTAGPQKVTLTGMGLFDFTGKKGTFDLTADTGTGKPGGTVAERITGGTLYVSLPTTAGVFYKLALADLAGTSIGSSTDPTAPIAALQGVTGEVKKVGSEKVRDADTTHYRGTIDVAKAIAAASGQQKAELQSTLGKSSTPTVPFDANVDGQGRLRRYSQVLKASGGGSAAGQQVSAATTIELYDFGTPVTVQVPPPAAVKDGAPLLASLKAPAAR